MPNFSAVTSRGVDIVTSCVGCSTHANFVATLALIATLMMVAWSRQFRAASAAR